MNSEEKKTLRNARKEVCELQSLGEALKMVNSRLFGIPTARIGDETRGTADSCVKEHLMDQKNNVENDLVNVRLRTITVLADAEKIIEQVKRPEVRASLRYYYMCGKSLRETARLVQRSEKTIKRWFYREL